jgi:hypothetical protein
MLFGIREICDVVFKAKANQKIGNKIFYKGEPVIYFDSLKTSTLEGAATTVYATGGRGNARLIAWEGERTLTFTMEDALISPIGISILTGAGLIASGGKEANIINVHTTETTVGTLTNNVLTIELEETPATGANCDIYVMLLDDNGDVETEPYLVKSVPIGKTIKVESKDNYVADFTKYNNGEHQVLVDYYIAKAGDDEVLQIEITPDKFGGNFYVEASTLFRNKAGVDLPAEFIIPNAKVQSNFTFTMAGSGDPSTFTFTMDAFPDYTRFDNKKKVMAAIQVITENVAGSVLERVRTASEDKEIDNVIVREDIEIANLYIAGDSELAVGEVARLAVAVEPATASNSVTWSADGSGTVAINNAGVVTALKAGSATITATSLDGKKSTTHTITVSAVEG